MEQDKITTVDFGAMRAEPNSGCRNIYKTYNNTERSRDMENDKILELYINKIDKDQSELKKDLREREERIDKRIAETEARTEKKLEKIEKMILEQNRKIDDLSDKITEKLEDDKKYRHTNNIAIIIGVVTTVIAMVGIYYATISAITDILGFMQK